MKITFIRHAESEYNHAVNNNLVLFDPKYINCSITSKGQQQAKLLNFKFDLLIMSILRRTHETYLHSNIETVFCQIEPLFREHRKDISDFIEGEEMIQETDEEIKNRVLLVSNYLKNLKEKYENVGIITHRDFIKAYMKCVYDEECVLNNCEYIIIEI